jgi:aryl-alcohol dehydrogenase
MVKTRKSQRWSQRVTKRSNALDLEAGVFTLASPRLIAESLRRSAESSARRKAGTFQSAMSMLNFYINRAGSQLDVSQRDHLEAAKDELRGLYGRARKRPKSGRRAVAVGGTRKAAAAPPGTRAIRAAVVRAAGRPLRIETLELESPRDDEVLVRIVASGICRTDIDMYDEWREADGAAVLGHEGAGVVEQVGRRVRGLRRGDHVVLSYQSCGRCAACRHGHPSACSRMGEANFGFRRLDGSNALQGSGVQGHFFGQSSFASYVLATRRNAVKVPKHLPLAMLAPLGCGLQTGAGTVMNALKVRRGEGIAVFGTGSVGLAAVMAARILGADPIIGVDIVPSRLRLARQLGATEVIDARRADVGVRLASGVNYVVETTGDATMYRTAVRSLKPRGVVALMTGGPDAVLPGGRRAVGIVEGDAVPQRFIPKLIRLWQSGRFPFDRLVKFYRFRDINRAIADSRRGVTVKPVLRISDT